MLTSLLLRLSRIREGYVQLTHGSGPERQRDDNSVVAIVFMSMNISQLMVRGTSPVTNSVGHLGMGGTAGGPEERHANPS